MRLSTTLRSALILIGAFTAVTSNAAISIYNGVNATVNASVRADWLTACGIASCQFAETFEGIPVNTNLHNLSGILPGQMIVRDTSVGAAYVRTGGSYFGGTPPIDLQGLAHNERAYLELDVSALPVDYLAWHDMDNTGYTIRVTYWGGTVTTHSSDGGTTPEFLGIYRNDMPRILKVELDATGDGEWGLDNLEFGCVAEHALISGTVTLNDYVGTVLGEEVYCTLRNSSGLPVEGFAGRPLAADGSFSFTTDRYGTYGVGVKGRTWLSKVTPAQLITSAGVSGLEFTLINGDVDNDDEIGPGDFGELSAAFGSVEGDENWNRNADLDGDAEVGPSDFGILSANFGLSGE